MKDIHIERRERGRRTPCWFTLQKAVTGAGGRAMSSQEFPLVCQRPRYALVMLCCSSNMKLYRKQAR